MNTHYAREQLAETCRQIGADFTYDEAEGEAAPASCWDCTGGAWSPALTVMTSCGIASCSNSNRHNGTERKLLRSATVFASISKSSCCRS